MSITLDITGIDALRSAIPEVKEKIINAMTKGMVHGLELFLAKIQREQMSGPTGQASVSVINNHLRRNWYVIPPQNVGGDIVTKLRAEETYALVHQTGSKDWDGTYPANVTNKAAWRRLQPKHEPGAPRRHNIPKRLHIIEDYARYGPEILSAEIVRQLNQVR
ncbi:MAG: hypothetical protein WBM07_10830 [Chitinivibrionales bacterium]